VYDVFNHSSTWYLRPDMDVILIRPSNKTTPDENDHLGDFVRDRGQYLAIWDREEKDSSAGQWSRKARAMGCESDSSVDTLSSPVLTSCSQYGPRGYVVVCIPQPGWRDQVHINRWRIRLRASAT